jgi:simple sugar transport system ATP-binding protein
VVLIAHKLREVLSVADRITVLRRGRVVLTSLAKDVTEEQLAAAMLGDDRRMHDATGGSGERGDRTTTTPPGTRNTVIDLRGVSVRDATGIERLRDATLSIDAGEIVGVAAVEGAGQRELLRVMSGRLRPTHGTAQLPSAVGFVPEDRHRDAVVLDATLTENVALRGAGARRGLLPWNTLHTETQALMAARDVRAAAATVSMRTLSGGNQQKLVLGRELASSPEALVVENPTRGLDILATRDVHAALRAARDAGTAVVVYSSDLDEVLAMADRVLVVSGGSVREVGRDRDVVGRAMLAAGS